MHGGDENRADVAAGPASIGTLRPQQVLERGLAILAPGQTVVEFRIGEQLGVTILAEDVERLGVVVVGIFIMAETAAAEDRQVLLAKTDPALDERRVVVARAEATRDGRRRQSRPALAPTAAA